MIFDKQDAHLLDLITDISPFYCLLTGTLVEVGNSKQPAEASFRFFCGYHRVAIVA